MKLHTYWRGSMPRIIKRCIETMEKNHGHVEFLPRTDKGLTPAMESDWARWQFLSKNGGTWIDADCIVLKNLKSLEPESGISLYKESQGWYATGFVSAHPLSRTAWAMHKAMNFVPIQGRTSWAGNLLNDVVYHREVQEINANLIYPIKYDKHWFWFDNTDISVAISGLTIMLTHGIIEECGNEDPIEMNNNLGAIFRHALEITK